MTFHFEILTKVTVVTQQETFVEAVDAATDAAYEALTSPDRPSSLPDVVLVQTYPLGDADLVDFEISDDEDDDEGQEDE